MFLLANQVQSSTVFFWVLLGYSLCYMPTLSLANAVCFNQMKDTEKNSRLSGLSAF